MKTPQQILDHAREEFEKLPTEKKDIFPPQEDTCRICRDYKNHAHSPDREAIGYNEALEKLIPVFKSFHTSTFKAFLEAEIEHLEGMKKKGFEYPNQFNGTEDYVRGINRGFELALSDQISHLKELLVTLKK